MKKIKVWDLAVRAGHWATSALVLGAFLTSEDDDWTTLHTRLGLVVLGILLFRLAWGFVGTKHARFKDFVKSPREVLAYARDYVRGKPGLHLGHNPLGAVMVLALLGDLLIITVTGLLTYLGPEFDGPLSRVLPFELGKGIAEAHEFAAHALMPLVFLHVTGVIVSSVLERQNLIFGMIHGRKRAEDADEPIPPRRRLAGSFTSAAIAIAVVVALWNLMPEAEAATPLLEQYAADAKREDPAFKGFDAAAGRALYYSERPKSDGSVSCATCHTSDPKAEGRSPAGKRLLPLAPSANPERFTDRKKADKWFDRNCKQVLGRLCTAKEKGDLLTWLVTL